MYNNSRAVILAAGRSTRFTDGNKLTIKFDDETLVRRTVSAWTQIVGTVDVLVPRDDAEVTAAIDNLPVNIIPVDYNAQRPDSSLKQYFEQQLLSDGSGLFISLADLYLLDAKELKYLIEAYSWRPETMGVVPKYQGERGHPIWLPQNVLGDFLDSGMLLHDWLEAYPLRVSWLPVDNRSVIADIDTREDLEAIVQPTIEDELDPA